MNVKELIKKLEEGSPLAEVSLVDGDNKKHKDISIVHDINMKDIYLKIKSDN